MKNTDKDVQCRLGTIRILREAFSGTRSILYFRHTTDQKPGFVEWPGKLFSEALASADDIKLVHMFKEPKEPTKKCKALTLESSDGRSLSIGKGLSRRSTSGSVTTIASFETSAGPAFARLQERSTGLGSKGIKGLVIEFHEPHGM